PSPRGAEIACLVLARARRSLRAPWFDQVGCEKTDKGRWEPSPEVFSNPTRQRGSEGSPCWRVGLLKTALRFPDSHFPSLTSKFTHSEVAVCFSYWNLTRTRYFPGLISSGFSK